MEFLKGYMKIDEYRYMLNSMTYEIFGFTFENWYQAGFYLEEYIPYSYIEGGKIIANASANIMRYDYFGSEKLYIQIGTVMTRPEYRNRGLARQLIKTILSDYSDIADGFYLFANLNAVDFYKKIGFNQIGQWLWHWDDPIKRNCDVDSFIPVGKERREAYVQMLKNSVCNADFDHINRCSLQMFYTMDMNDVFYCNEIDCFAVMRVADKVLYLDSLVSNRILSIEDVASRIDGNFEQIVFGFTPKEKSFLRTERFDGKDKYRLMYLGSSLECIEAKKLCIPIMSHA